MWAIVPRSLRCNSYFCHLFVVATGKKSKAGAQQFILQTRIFNASVFLQVYDGGISHAKNHALVVVRQASRGSRQFLALYLSQLEKGHSLRKSRPRPRRRRAGPSSFFLDGREFTALNAGRMFKFKRSDFRTPPRGQPCFPSSSENRACLGLPEYCSSNENVNRKIPDH